MRHIWILALLAACSDDHPEATKAGTVVYTWELSQSDRESIRSAKQSEKKVHDLDYVAQASPFETNMPIKLKVRLETATVAFQEDGKEVTHTAPVKLEVTVVDANGFKIDKAKCAGPHYDMALPPGRDMILPCTFSADKKKHDLGFSIYVYGDGRLDDGMQKKK